MNYGRWTIARRTLFSSRQRFVPLLAGTAFTGIALGVFFLIVVLSVMKGFQQELNRRWIGLNAHLTVTHLPMDQQAPFQNWPEVQEAERFASGEVILQTEMGEETVSIASKLKGVEKLSPAFLSQMELYPKDPPEGTQFFLGGSELFATLGIHPDYPHPLNVVYPFGEIGPTGDYVPKTKKFIPTHVFRTGLYLWDAYTIVVPYKEARDLLGEFAETGWQIRLKNIADIETVEKHLAQVLPAGAKIETFAKQNAKLFAALKLERMGMTLLLFLFLLIASFSIAGLLLMFLFAKQRDLAILRAIGFSPEETKKLYSTLGLLLGGLGSLTGALLSFVLCYLLIRHPIPLPSTYYLDYLPVKVSGPIVVGSLGVGVVLAWVASLYPARQGSQMEILPLLREE